METATTVHITRLTEPDELFCRYRPQDQPQPCHVSLDLEDGELTAAYNPQVGPPYGIPKSVYERRVLWQAIPCLTAVAANRLLEEVAPTAQRILAGATIEWDGSNHIGVLDDAAQVAYDELADACDPERFDPDDEVSAWDADDWFNGSHDDTIERLGITADTTDEDIARIAEQEADDAKDTAHSGYVVLHGAEPYLLGLREELRDVEREELREVAAQLAALTDRRAELIRRLAAWGDSSRAVGANAGLSHVRVQQIAAGA